MSIDTTLLLLSMAERAKQQLARRSPHGAVASEKHGAKLAK
jgi:hypothetical protein